MEETQVSDYWREFEKNDITHSAAHYLMAIDSLRDSRGYARVTDVADVLDVSRGAASMSITQLKRRGWVAEDPNRFLLLTDQGHDIAHAVEHKFRILSRFFEEILGVPRETALRDACKMEHLISPETGRRLVWLMRYVLSDETRSEEVHQAMTCFRDGCESTDECPLCASLGQCEVDPLKDCSRRSETSNAVPASPRKDGHDRE